MAWLMVLEGGSVSIESDDAQSVIDAVESDPQYVDLVRAIKGAGLEFCAQNSVDAHGDGLAVFMLGKDLHRERYLDKSEVCTIDTKLAPEERVKADKFVEDLDSLLESAGHKTVRICGIVINHFD